MAVTLTIAAELADLAARPVCVCVFFVNSGAGSLLNFQKTNQSGCHSWSRLPGQFYETFTTLEKQPAQF